LGLRHQRRIEEVGRVTLGYMAGFVLCRQLREAAAGAQVEGRVGPGPPRALNRGCGVTHLLHHRYSRPPGLGWCWG
jgi:hypothetical protein